MQKINYIKYYHKVWFFKISKVALQRVSNVSLLINIQNNSEQLKIFKNLG